MKRSYSTLLCGQLMVALLPVYHCHAADNTSRSPWQPAEWPVLRHYDSAHLREVALPLGGIGTGTVSLGGRGELRDWEIMNVPAHRYSTVTDGNDAPFFAIRVQPEGDAALTRMLAGPLLDDEYLHHEGRPVNHHGLPRFSHAEFDAAYPFGQVSLSDEELPVRVRVKGFNPLVPGDEELSGLPLAVLSYEVTNLTDRPLTASVCGSLRNFVGRDGSDFGLDWKGDLVPIGGAKNRNVWMSDDDKGVHGLLFQSDGVDSLSTAWGSICLTTDAADGVSYRTFSADNAWSVSILDFWDDFSDDGSITNPVANARKTVGQDQDPMGSLCVKQRLAPGESRTFNFYLTWNFPNRKGWSNSIVGNWYSTQHPDPWTTACEAIAKVGEYERETLAFVQALLDTSCPDVVKEAALFNLSVLRSQTVFRLASGHLMGWEGVMERVGSCAGSCTHVWNYETATAFLFGRLACSMREVETEYATHDDGSMAFRVTLPLQNPDPNYSVAADGQMGCVMKFYREWQLSGDHDFLATHWAAVKSNLAYAWVERGWDGNRDGIMEGSQHNTMDVNYFGPNPQMGFWYLGALRAGEEMALAMKDKAFARECRRLFENGSQWMDENLFNGEYYEHRITDPGTFAFMDPASPDLPPYQLGPGCLVDQLVGQYMAHLCGLGYLGNKEHQRTTLQSIMKYNFLEDFSAHFNNMRSYVMGDEAGLLMASWPKGRLEVPFPYFNESMTGFEYTAAVGMLYEGMEDEALRCVKAIRDRFDGSRRNPFSEPECGHHYARSMASWSLIPAYSGFHWSGVDKAMAFNGREGVWFWSNGYAWGTVDVKGSQATLHLLHGTLDVRSFALGEMSCRTRLHLSQGESATLMVK